MASLLNNASLLLNPAGSIISYQEDKIYSVLPKDGTGDFTFIGGDGGTRVNQQGYIEQTPANLNTYSEKFGGGYWNNFGGTITDDSVVAPNGTVTGTTFNGSPAGTYKTFSGLTAGQVYTVSAYVKLGTATNCVFIVNNSIAWNTVGGQSFTSTNGLNTTDWTRISYTFTCPSNGQINWHIGQQFESGVTQQTNGTYFVWGAMLNIGSTAKPYQPTTDRLNYPRITYQNGKGALLQEPQRTNLFIQSQNFATYGVYNYTQTLNAAISPDGTQNASKIVETTANGGHQYEPSFSATSGQAYTISIFVKAAERTQFHIFAFADNGVFNSTDAFYDLAAGTVISGTGASIEKWPNGWYRCIRTMTAGATGTGYWGIGIAVNGVASYTGDGSSGIYMWGGQNEAGEFASTYIPTTSATVTRPLDQFYKNDSPALSSTSWTFYMSGVNIGKNQNSSGANIDNVNWSFDSGAGPYGPNSLHNYSNTIYYYDTVNGAANLGDIGSTTTKFAVTKNGTTFKLFRNGVLATTNTLSLASNVWDSFRMYGVTDAQGQAFSNNPSTLAILPSALSDADAQSLTTVRSGSGGTISYYGPYTIHTFTGSATFTPSFTGPVEVLVVAGGGGAGGGGGGGGAGGLLYVSSAGVSQGTGYTITVGAGGVGYNSNTAGTNGSNSSAFGLNAIGGAGGSAMVNGQASLIGGSGGGGTINTIAGSGTVGQGNNGGNGGQHSTQVWSVGGGGGGAGAAGQNFNGRGTDLPGNGGIGLPYSISGFSTYYAGGGGGGTQAGTQNGGTGGLGGGGNGGQGASISSGLAQDGVSGLGGGGGASNEGGGQFGKAGNGGSGVVIVRYLT